MSTDVVYDAESPISPGIPLQRDSFPSYSEAHGIGANVQTLAHDKRKIKRLDPQQGGLSLDTLSISQNGMPELSSNGSPSTSAESSIRTPPFYATKHGEVLKPAVISRASSGYASTDASSTEHSAAGSEAEDERPVPKKEDSISSVTTIKPAAVKPETVKPELAKLVEEEKLKIEPLDDRTAPLTPQKSSMATASPPLTAASSPKPGFEKKQSTVGKLFQHRDKATTPPTPLPATKQHPPPSKSAGARSPAMPQSGDESDGHQSDTSTSSATSALRSLGRRFSSRRDEAPPKPTNDGETAQMARRGSSKASTSDALVAPALDGRTGKMERKKSEAKPEGHMTLKEYVAAHAGKMTRKPSTASHKSDDDRSERDGEETASLASRNRSGSTAANLSTASLLKKYGVCEKVAIGKGATAVVRLAHKWDRSTERLYAVKEFRKRRKNETEREYIKKLTSEFCISSTLHHAHVVETVDLVQDENHHWCEVMEYCPGGDLYAAIKKGDMNIKEIHSYFKQMILGVAYLHSMGVAHRDIKPENLLLDAKGYVKITDFGVSDVFRMCWEKGTHLSKGLCGSEPYIAAEMWEEKEYDARAVDVWACAIVFYCMVAQELPWRAARKDDPTYQNYVERYSQPNPPPLSVIQPKECRSLIKRMLDPNPSTRIMIEQCIQDPWLKSIEIVETTPPGHSASVGS